MNLTGMCGAILLLTAGFPAGAARAQDAGDDQVAVWAVIERLWTAANDGDTDWVDEMLTGDFVGWSYDSPAPRTRASVGLWTEFGRRQSKPVNYELYPLSIVVHGDTAIAHYLYTNAAETSGGEIVTSNGRYTDVLVREDGEWKFLSWHGGDFPPEER